jgi:hypothetical protein
MQAMPSPASGMPCGALVAIVPVLRQDCYCLSALYGSGGVYLTGLVWMCYNRFLFSLPSGIPQTAQTAYSAKNEHDLAETALNA